jgi:hypothetical protein
VEGLHVVFQLIYMLLVLAELSYNQVNYDFEIAGCSDLGGAEGKVAISLKKVEFSFKQFAKRIAQPSLVHSTSGKKYR